MTQGELGKVALQIIVAAYGTIRCDCKQLLILRPADAFDDDLVPGNTPDKLAGSAVDVYARLGRCPCPVSYYLFGISVKCFSKC